MKRIIVVAHKDLTHPDDELVSYLNDNKCDDLLHINHSFFYAKDRKSWYIWYKKGNVYRTHTSLDYAFLPEPLLYLKEAFFTLFWILQTGRTWNMYIGMDGLCVLWGNLLRSLGRVKKTAYWAIDFVPEKRFGSSWKNRIYHLINTNGYRQSDEMWDLSPRMAEAREKFLGFTQSMYKSHKVVPYGVWTKKLKRYTYADCEKNTLVYMGHISKKQGVQIVIEAIPLIIKKNPEFSFKIIGKGDYTKELEVLAKKLGVIKYCDFRGKIDDYSLLEDEVAKSCVAVAPYVKDFDIWTYYADPGKVKTYLGCGVPVVVSDIPWNSHEIEKMKCGVIADQNKIAIAEKVLYLMDSKRNGEYRRQAIKYAESFNYANIFDRLLL